MVDYYKLRRLALDSSLQIDNSFGKREDYDYSPVKELAGGIREMLHDIQNIGVARATYKINGEALLRAFGEKSAEIKTLDDLSLRLSLAALELSNVEIVSRERLPVLRDFCVGFSKALSLPTNFRNRAVS